MSCRWWEVVHGKKKELAIYSYSNIHWLRLKCRIVTIALEIVMEKTLEKTLYECCNKAVRRVNKADGFVHIKMGETVTKWRRKYRILAEQFANPAVVRMNGRSDLPPFLDKNSNAKKAIIQNAQENLSEFSPEFLHTYIQEKVLPTTAKACMREIRQEMRERRERVEEFEEDVVLSNEQIDM